jgi:hypothetical protein
VGKHQTSRGERQARRVTATVQKENACTVRFRETPAARACLRQETSNIAGLSPVLSRRTLNNAQTTYVKQDGLRQPCRKKMHALSETGRLLTDAPAPAIATHVEQCTNDIRQTRRITATVQQKNGFFPRIEPQAPCCDEALAMRTRQTCITCVDDTFKRITATT